MRPNHILALFALFDVMIQVLPWLYGFTRAVPLGGFIGAFVVVGLFFRKKLAFRAYRFYLWCGFLLAIFFLWAILFADLVNRLPRPFENFPPWVPCVIALLYTVRLLYYTDTDKVRNVFGLPPKKARKNSDDEELTPPEASTE